MILHYMDILFQDSFDFQEIASFRRIAERKRHPRFPRPSGAADAMDITFWLIRQLKVDDMADILYIDSTRGDIDVW